MPRLASWIRPKDEKFFHPILAQRPEIEVCNAARQPVAVAEMDALLLTGGRDISQEFLRQPVPDSSVLEEGDLPRDEWEFTAVQNALTRGLPIFAICKGLQVLNVALGGTLRLDIRGHDLPEQKSHDIQPLRNDAAAAHRFPQVNSSHHQAIDRVADGLTIESWCAEDDIIEQVRLTDRPFGLAVQYHPERGEIYGPLFTDFLDRINGIQQD
ncbi:MAG: gamma-glutamyl-gamma-aminobutyrate hydrolase family protein [Chthoniobacterales bacterium]|nr:gamma-glutamyl-gamma-aminobutyrate hydrolase family protein [Chthoniobacterales bacterium]